MCVIDTDYGDNPPRLFNQQIIQARKQHKCNECYQPILPGQKYEYVTGLWEQGFDRFRTCLACVEVRDKFFCSYIYGQVWSDLSECEFSLADIEALSPEARVKIDDLYLDQDMD